MTEVLSVDNMRRSDAYTIENITGSRELMYRAGTGIYRAVEWKSPTAVVCGSGNNAGDGYVLAKLLHDGGTDVTLILLTEKFSEDGRFYFDICRDAGIPCIKYEPGTDLTGYAMIADCILGTGFKGQVREPYRSAIEAINRSGAYVVSADINSGLNGDSGMADVCVNSDLTVSIGSFMPGLFLNMAKDVMKEKINCDIGIESCDEPFYLIEKDDLKGVFKERKNYSNKGTYGYIALVGGSARYSGAIRLAYLANAAMRSGAGVVKAAVPGSICGIVASHILESTVYPLSDTGGAYSLAEGCTDGIRDEGKPGEIVYSRAEFEDLTRNVKSVAFGMGIGTGAGAEAALRFLLSEYKGRLIIDADGLTLLSKMDAELLRSSEADIVLTPHIKEFSRLTGLTMDEILAAPVETARAYAEDRKVILLLKGPSTIITDGKRVYLTDRGCPGMATAGSGDVLSGIMSAVCAYGGEDLLLAAAGAAYINGRAGELAEEASNSISMTALDTVSHIAKAISEVME